MIENRVGQRHPAPALIDSGQCNVRAGNLKDRISRHQGGCVPVRPESEVDKVQHWRRAGCLRESRGVSGGCSLHVWRFYRRGIDLLGAERAVTAQAFMEVTRVSRPVARLTS